MAAAPWLSRPWRRTAWIALAAVGAARLITGTVLPAELVLAFASGVTVGAAVLVAFGVPDRRIGSEGIAAALRSAGLPVASVEPAGVVTKGSRPFVAVTDDGRRLFIKALGSDQRDADLLYRAYRFARLRNVGDTWPAASVIRAVEHQALVGTMAERAGVRVPRVDRVIKAGGGTALLVMDRVDGSSLGQLPAQQITRRPPPAAVGRSRQAAPRRDRPPVPADGQRDDRGRRAALADRLQLLRAGRHAAANGP